MTTEPDKDVEAIQTDLRDVLAFLRSARARLIANPDEKHGPGDVTWAEEVQAALGRIGDAVSNYESRLLTAEGEAKKWQAAFESKQLYPISEMEQKLAACEVKLEDAEEELARIKAHPLDYALNEAGKVKGLLLPPEADE